MSTESFEHLVGGSCPFCPGTWEAGVVHMPDPEAAAPFAVNIHSLPPCKTFNDLDPHEFVRAVRMAGLH